MSAPERQIKEILHMMLLMMLTYCKQHDIEADEVGEEIHDVWGVVYPNDKL